MRDGGVAEMMFGTPATLATPTVESADVERAALTVLDRFPLHRPVRLLGVRVELTPAE